MPLVSFYTPWKYQKTRGIGEWNGLKHSNSEADIQRGFYRKAAQKILEMSRETRMMKLTFSF